MNAARKIDGILRESGDALKTHALEEQGRILLHVENLGLEDGDPERCREFDELLNQEARQTLSAEVRVERQPQLPQVTGPAPLVAMECSVSHNSGTKEGQNRKNASVVQIANPTPNDGRLRHVLSKEPSFLDRDSPEKGG